MSDKTSLDTYAFFTGFFGAVTIFAVLSNLPPIVASITGGGTITMSLFSIRKTMEEITIRKEQLPKSPNGFPPVRDGTAFNAHL